MASRWDTRGGSSRRTWLAIAGKINEDLHREIMLTEADYAWDHLFSRISLWIEQSIHHMQPHLTSYHTRLLIKTPSFSLPFPPPILGTHFGDSVSSFNLFTIWNHTAESYDVWYYVVLPLNANAFPIRRALFLYFNKLHWALRQNYAP